MSHIPIFQSVNMVKLFFRSLVFTLCLLFLGALKAQVSEYYEQPRLYIGQINNLDKSVEIQYEITMPGYVELHLFDPKGKKIWLKGQVRNKKGNYYIRIPSEPMEKNARYEFVLKFKGREEKSSFYSPE